MFGSSLRILASIATVTSVPVTARLMPENSSQQTLRALQATNHGGRAARFESRVEAVRASEGRSEWQDLVCRFLRSVPEPSSSRRQALEGNIGYSTYIDRSAPRWREHSREPKAIW